MPTGGQRDVQRRIKAMIICKVKQKTRVRTKFEWQNSRLFQTKFSKNEIYTKTKFWFLLNHHPKFENIICWTIHRGVTVWSDSDIKIINARLFFSKNTPKTSFFLLAFQKWNNVLILKMSIVIPDSGRPCPFSHIFSRPGKGPSTF